MKLHIILTEESCRDPSAKGEVLRSVLSRVEIQGLNRRRFEKHGVISGDADLGEDPEARLDMLRRTAGVQAVNLDERKFAI